MLKGNCLRAAALAAVGVVGSTAGAETIYGITDAGVLFRLNSANPGILTNVGVVTGLNANHTSRGIDFRPLNGALYLVSSNASGSEIQLYSVNLSNAALTPIGSSLTITNSSTRISIDFNPAVDRIRLVTGGGTNLRLNPDTGALAATDTSLAYAPGQPFTGTPLVGGVAYSNNFAGATTTTLYGYDFSNDEIVTIGSVSGAPTSPNTGQLFDVGDTGIIASSASMGMDISSATGVCYLNADLTPTGGDSLYSVNLATGATTLVGPFGGPTAALAVLDLSVLVPEPALLGTMALLALVRRNRLG